MKKNNDNLNMEKQETTEEQEIKANSESIYDFNSPEAKELFARKQVEDVMNKVKEMAKSKQNLKEETVVLALLNAHLAMEEADMVLAKLKQEIDIKDSKDELEDVDSFIGAAGGDDPVKIYLKDIGRYPLLSHQEVIETAKIAEHNFVELVKEMIKEW